MSYQEELLRFLEQPENFHFLMEIEPMIDQVKSRIYQKYLNELLESGIKPRLWPGYSIQFQKSYLLLVSSDANQPNLIHPGIFWRYRAGSSTKYFGAITPEKINPKGPEVDALKQLLQSLDMRIEPGTEFFGWSYFNKTDDQLLRQPVEEVYDCLKNWADVFWNFAEQARMNIEALNKVLKK